VKFVTLKRKKESVYIFFTIRYFVAYLLILFHNVCFCDNVIQFSSLNHLRINISSKGQVDR